MSERPAAAQAALELYAAATRLGDPAEIADYLIADIMRLCDNPEALISDARRLYASEQLSGSGTPYRDALGSSEETRNIIAPPGMSQPPDAPQHRRRRHRDDDE